MSCRRRAQETEAGKSSTAILLGVVFRGCAIGQWYSTWGTRTPWGMRRHLKGYVKLKTNKYIFHDKHCIIRARFRVSHKSPRRKDMRFGSAISLSLSLLYAILIWAASFILFHIVHIIYLLFNSLTLHFSHLKLII
jgi:hypothetical protein